MNEAHPTRESALALWVTLVREAVTGNRWITHRWVLRGLTPGVHAPGPAEGHTTDASLCVQRCPDLALHPDEAEGYLLNVQADEPSLFLMLRDPDPVDAAPAMAHLPDDAPRVAAVTASFFEAARWLDGGAQVERMPLPPGWKDSIEHYARQHLRPPEEKKPKRRYAAAGDKQQRPGH